MDGAEEEPIALPRRRCQGLIEIVAREREPAAVEEKTAAIGEETGTRGAVCRVLELMLGLQGSPGSLEIADGIEDDVERLGGQLSALPVSRLLGLLHRLGRELEGLAIPRCLPAEVEQPVESARR